MAGGRSVAGNWIAGASNDKTWSSLWARRVGVGLMWIVAATGWLGPASADWKGGTARAIITPESPVWLAGYGTRRAPDGKIHDLWLKVLALEDGAGHRAVLITSDFQGVPRGMSDQVFERLREQYGLEREAVMFSFSHNHCGPRLGDDLVDYYPVDAEQERLVADYTAQMVELTVRAVGEALQRMVPVELRQGAGQAGFAVNRRNNPEAEVAQQIASGRPLVGPVDHSVPVLKVTQVGGEPIAVVFGYACHPTTLNFNSWCGDYPGFAQLEIEAEHPGAAAMFVNTCGGDQNPLPRRSVELCRRYGRELADAVERTLDGPLESIGDQLQLKYQRIPLAYERVVDRSTLEPLLADANPIRARWARRMLDQLASNREFEAEYPYPIHVWRLGKEMTVIGMGAEVVVDYALKFKREFGPGTWVCGYVDDMVAYIPSRRVWEEGGYEGGPNLFEYGRPAFRWSGDVEDRITAEVRRQVNQVRLSP